MCTPACAVYNKVNVFSFIMCMHNFLVLMLKLQLIGYLAEVRLKFVSVRPAIDNDYEKRVKYDVTWKTQVFIMHPTQTITGNYAN